MREDMFKVIVERPRLVHSNPTTSDGRLFRNDAGNGNRLGIKRGYNNRKSLNENLAPLKRYLEQQINRPWDKVYSEIRAQIDPRSTVKQHILLHLDNFVELQTRWRDTPDGGEIIVLGDYGSVTPLAESRVKLFVHPKTGILLRNRRYKPYVSHWQKQLEEARRQTEPVLRVIDEHTQLRRLEGIWYQVEWQELPAPKEVMRDTKVGRVRHLQHELRWDVLRKAWVSLEHGQRVYAKSKRQLNSKELAQHQSLLKRKAQ